MEAQNQRKESVMQTELNQVTPQTTEQTSEVVVPQQEGKEAAAPEVQVQNDKISLKQSPGTLGTPAAAPYQPNFKFKVLGAEHEIPELLRGAIKDADSEKFVRQIFEKAYGLEPIKEKYNQHRTEYQSLKGNFETMQSEINEARECYNRGDFDNLFKKLNIPEEKVLQWVVDKVNYNQLPPEQKQALDAKKAAEQQKLELEKSYTSETTQLQQQLAQHKQQMLDLVLERSDYQQVMQGYDSKKGPGKFRELVVTVAQNAWYTQQKDLSPMEAVKGAIELLGVEPQNPAAAMAAAAQGVAQPASSQSNVPAKKVTIPNLGSGKAASPAKPKFTSVDDLKREYDKIAGQ
jgi:hypothetical protein